MAWNVRIGDVEPDAVPGPVFPDRGFQETETPADARPSRFRDGPGSSARVGPCPAGRRGAHRRRGIVERLPEELQRSRPGSRRALFGRTEPRPRRKHHVRRVVAVLVHLDRVIVGEPDAELRFDRFPGRPQQAFAKVAVRAGFRDEGIQGVDRFPAGPQATCLLTSSRKTPSAAMSSLKEPLWTTLPACRT